MKVGALSGMSEATVCLSVHISVMYMHLAQKDAFYRYGYASSTQIGLTYKM